MNNVEISEKINLKDIVDISEDDFKRQISAWIDERGISRKLQSKLRADLFDQFNRTKLGRQMTQQHQQVHQIVLSPLILVLNTLVAEFLYTEDCHFTLSVFTNEVPYKNTLPNFEETPTGQLFQFSQSELSDILEAVGIPKQNEHIVRESYMNSSQEMLNKSLLYCIIKTLVIQIDSGRNDKINRKSKRVNEKKRDKDRPSTTSAVVASTSSQQSDNRSPQSGRKGTNYESREYKNENLQISSRYFKYLNRYLDILSDRINDMSKSLADKRSDKKSARHADSSTQEESLKKDLRKIIENINKLTKSQHKSKRFQGVLNSIERLSASVEKCNGKLEHLLKAMQAPSKNVELVEKKVVDNKVDRFSGMDYASWLRELKISEHGRKFIDRLEVSLQKTMEKERENLEKLYEEKTNNYRMLIRLHYKQKYDTNKGEQESGDRTEKDNSSPVDKFTPYSTEKLLAESLAGRAIEKEQHVDEIVQSAKIRLQQLERESEDLDQSFQAYLRRQQIMKQQVSYDASKIWENYSLSKAALSQFDSISNQNINATHQTNDKTKMDQFFNSTFKDDIDVQEVLKDLNEIKRLKSPPFNKDEAFSKENLLQKLQRNSFIDKRPVINYKEKFFDSQLKIALPEYKDFVFGHNEKKVENEKEKREEVKEQAEQKVQEQHKKIKNQKEIHVPPASALAFASVSTSVEIAPISTMAKSNGSIKLTENKSPESKATASILTSSAITNGKKIDSVENGLNIPDRIPPHTTTLNNGKSDEKDEILKVSEDKKDVEITFSPLKLNGFNKIPEFKPEPKNSQTNGFLKQTEVKSKNGFKSNKTVEFSEKKSKGISSKLPTFVSRVSESDSIEGDSDQISIGAQRQVKSPDDFWI